MRDVDVKIKKLITTLDEQSLNKIFHLGICKVITRTRKIIFD